jgi:DUF4097 and DUF4098 domain-containing protein YvlB
MATYPPPPGGRPPAGPPSGNPFNNVRNDWRNIKQQARAQRAQFRAERYQAKAQARILREQARNELRAMRRSSILGPVLLVAVGVLFLLVEAGRVSFNLITSLYSRWWPLLFVGAGVVLLLEWAIDHQRAAEGVAYTRRGVGGGVVFLLIMLGVVGAGMGGFGQGRQYLSTHANEFGIDEAQLQEFFGDKQESISELDEVFPAGSHLSINNPDGDVTIVGHSNDGRMHLTVNKTVYGWSKEESEHNAQLLTPDIAPSAPLGGNGSTHWWTLRMPTIEGAKADLTLTVPDSGEVLVTANRGDVSVSGMKAPVTVTALHGSVDLNDIAGPVIARTSSSGKDFTAHNITGDVTLKGKADDLNLSDITGQVALEGDFYGATHLEHLHGATAFETSRTHFTVARIDGEVDISNDATMTGEKLIGPTTLKTRSRNINFSDLAGDAAITDSNGRVELSMLAPLGNITVENRTGAVNVNLPEHSGFILQAETHDGKVTNNLDLPPTTDHSTTRVNGKLGDGKAQLDLRTTHADIDIHAGPGKTKSSDDDDDDGK